MNTSSVAAVHAAAKCGMSKPTPTQPVGAVNVDALHKRIKAFNMLCNASYK